MRTSGDIFAGRYEIEGRLGAGGMSTVYLALDNVLERRVALKILAEHLLEDEAFLTRFRNEARAAAGLTHPNIVQVYDFGEDEGHHFIVMEYVRGHSGAQLLRESGRLPVDEAVRIGCQACEGLGFAHRKGIVHRDVKPGNIMISDDGTVKIADFGIAKAAEQTRITRAGSVLGTAAYISPEQAHGEEATQASDIYSLGVVIYQFLAGRLPYESSSLTELALKQQNEEIEPLPSLAGEVPPELDRAIACALASDPANRYENANQMGEALTRALAGEEVAPYVATDAPTRMLEPETAETRVAERTSIEPTAVAPAGRSDKQKKGSGARRFFATLFILLLLGGGAAAAVVLTSNSGQTREFKQVVEDTAQDQIQGLKDLIQDSTR